MVGRRYGSVRSDAARTAIAVFWGLLDLNLDPTRSIFQNCTRSKVLVRADRGVRPLNQLPTLRAQAIMTPMSVFRTMEPEGEVI